MKNLLLIAALILVFLINANAQSDILLINLKNGKTDSIQVTQIQKMKFENITAVEEQLTPSNRLALKGNYPNPFGEQTNIEFEIENTGSVEIIIFDNNGKQIQTLKCDNCQSGKNTLQWNCLDKNNNRVQSGMYNYEVRFGKEVQSQKMILVK